MATPASLSMAIRDGHFVDAQGRVQILRGVNLGGSSKLPAEWRHQDQSDYAQFFDGAKGVTFVNRPFPLKDADLHFARLRRWGLTFMRFIVTWEAIEHEGPGIYDRDYIAYIRAIVEKSAEYGMQIYIDPHQDVWSRWTGGDGAPMWTLECVGFEPRNFEATKAALVLETCGIPASEFPKMIWPTNYYKLAAATMFTLFWAGKRFAPKCHVNGVQVQEYLQSHYCNALAELAKGLTGLPNVIGFGTMNEPSNGYIGTEDLSKAFGAIRNGFNPTALQGFALGEGIAQDVEVWSFSFNQFIRGRPDEIVKVDPKGTRAWKSGHHCIWKAEGVWDIDSQGQPRLLKPNHFVGLNFGTECFIPFAQRYAKAIQQHLPTAMMFLEMPPLEFGSGEFPTIDPKTVPLPVNAMHWYDLTTLFMTSWTSWFSMDLASQKFIFGRKNIQAEHRKQLAHTKSFGKKMGNAPTLIGETGIPFNLNGAKAYKNGDYTAQIEALDHTISCFEANLVSYTLWCYASDNDNKYGDQWNREDLSLVSPEQQRLAPRDRDAAARALTAFARPFASKIAGVPTKSEFSLDRARYELEYSSAEVTATGPTEIFVPHVQYRKGYRVTLADGKFEVVHHDGYDVVHYTHDARAKKHKVAITSTDPKADKQALRRKRRTQLAIATGVAAVGSAVFLYQRPDALKSYRESIKSFVSKYYTSV